MNHHQDVKGAQSITRAAEVLRLVGNSRNRGCTLTDVSQGAGLHLATAGRILTALVREGMLLRNPKTKKYYISYELYLLCSKSYLPRLKEELHDTLVRVAEMSEDTVYLIVPEGYDALCLDRVEGTYPIRTLTFDIGDRRPLGVGAGALALLASYPPDRVEEIIRANDAKYISHNNRAMDDVRGFVAETKENGFALSIGNVNPGATSVALPLLGPDGEALAAVAIAAVNERMQPDRLNKLVELLKSILGEVQLSSFF